MNIFDTITKTIKENILPTKNKTPKEAKAKKPKGTLAIAKPIDRKDWPKFMQGEKAVKEVYVGGCKFAKHWNNDTMGTAHAHADCGVLCFSNEKKWNTRLVRLHETAHLSANGGKGAGHTLNWAREFVRLDNKVNKWLDVAWLKKKYKFKIKKKTKSV